MNVRMPAIFALGALVGALAMSGFAQFRHEDPVMSASGRVQLDTASHGDPHLNNAIFINDPDAPQGRMYLKFSNDGMMNEAIGKNVTATGSLQSVKLDDGASITELHVSNLKYLP